jgi:hypothetical protein
MTDNFRNYVPQFTYIIANAWPSKIEVKTLQTMKESYNVDEQDGSTPSRHAMLVER